MGDDRSAGQQLRDLGGLVTGRNKIQGGRIVPKNPPPPPEPDDQEELEVDTTIRRG
jgi:hypothetical protein